MDSQVIEGNRQICLFANDKNTEQLLKDMAYDKTQGEDFHMNEEATLVQLKYHKSWSWLMPVWKKCIEVIGVWAIPDERKYKVWLDANDRIRTAIFCEVDCEKSAREISYLIQWYKSQNL